MGNAVAKCSRRGLADSAGDNLVCGADMLRQSGPQFGNTKTAVTDRQRRLMSTLNKILYKPLGIDCNHEDVGETRTKVAVAAAYTGFGMAVAGIILKAGTDPTWSWGGGFMIFGGGFI